MFRSAYRLFEAAGPVDGLVLLTGAGVESVCWQPDYQLAFGTHGDERQSECSSTSLRKPEKVAP